MIFFVTFLRALAACLITNAHYTGIYPSDIFANGGLIGDVLFFAVSGFCLCNIRYSFSVKGFAAWYGKRLWRIYPPVLIITAVYVWIGKYSLAAHPAVWWFIYPTNYHFVASILLLYIPFFLIMKTDVLRNRLGTVMCVLAGIWVLVYLFFYDKTYYHMDTVREPMIRFLFMESMLLGAWFRMRDAQLRNSFRAIYPVCTVFMCILYFLSKTGFSGGMLASRWQFLNQIVIFGVLFFIFRTFTGLDAKLERLPAPAKKITRFLADITLEIYLVQYVLIDVIRAQKFVFPVNWLLLTVSILLSAFLLHEICALIYKTADKLCGKREKQK